MSIISIMNIQKSYKRQKVLFCRPVIDVKNKSLRVCHQFHKVIYPICRIMENLIL